MTPRLFRFLLIVTAIMALPCHAAWAQKATVTVTPSSVVISPGQTIQLSAQVSGVPLPARVGWAMRGPRVPGADWGKLTNQGLYTAPAAPPPGQVFIVATVYGIYGQPVASQSVPVSFVSATPVVPAPPRPTVTQPTRPLPSVPPLPPASRLMSYLASTANKCQAAWNNRLALGPDGDALWSQLSVSEKVNLVAAIAGQRLGPGIAFQVLPPTAVVPNVARVTNDGTRTIWTFGIIAGGPQNGVLDLSLTRGGFGTYPNLYAFLCYETEIVRIRAQLQPSCTRSYYREVKTIIDGMNIYANPGAQAAAYGTFMQDVRRRYPNDEGKRMAASWLFEKIVVLGGNDSFSGPTPCDLPPAWGGPNYNKFLSRQLSDVVKFDHDRDALQRGRQG